MPYYRAPTERPRQSKRFLTIRDIEDAVSTGCREIVHAADLVITDAAREAAHDLGVAIVRPKADAPAAAPVAAVAAAIQAAAAQPPAPVLNSPPRVFAAQQHAGAGEQPLVQELVRAIRNKWQPVKRRQRQLLA